MSIACMTRVWNTSLQKGSGLLLLLAIADYADENGFAFPGIDTLAKKIRMEERNTRRLVERLEEAGELVVFKRPGRVHLYVIKVGATEEMVRKAKARAEAFGAVVEETSAEHTPDKMSWVNAMKPRTKSSGEVKKCPETPDIAMSTDPSLPLHQPCNDDDGIMHDEFASAIEVLKERRWNDTEEATVKFIQKHSPVYIRAICAHARKHNLWAGYIRKNAGKWQPSKNGDSDWQDRQRYRGGEFADIVRH